MIPSQSLSSTVLPGEYLLPDSQPSLTMARELGGVALNDPSQGLDLKVWTVETDGTDVSVYANSVPTVVLFSGTDITQVSLAFDQNMRPFVAFVEGGQAKYYWFDTQDGMNKISDLPSGSISPRCTLDDKRRTQTGSSDIILAYIRDNALYFRAQRDRYLVEYLLKTDMDLIAPNPFINSIGMNKVNRLQFSITSAP